MGTRKVLPASADNLKLKNMNRKNKKLTPAIPPEDYKGSVGEWMTELQTRGLWDGNKPSWHGDVMIPSDIWWEILEKCEGEE